MKSETSIKAISVILASISVGICLTFWGLVSGFENGYFYGILYKPPPSQFATTGPNFFQVSNTWYLTMSVSFCLYIIGNFLRPKDVSNFVCIASLCVALYPIWDMYFYKREVLAISYPFTYRYWLGISTYFDWYLLFAALALLTTQVVFIIRRPVDSEQRKIARYD